ncbi:UNVERIFIED_CONTAM: E3 ubiquitin-protein ligase BAH1 [Sesamum latifolium]|uniref:RING-type E3 ubiquitin transferase n=1 Tax=Sesamum latifolium TaxID=2727402 RepID=A0AAW2Y1M7_9LAMI
MKFCKKYEEYMQGQGQKKLPGVGFKKLKKILKRCRKQPHSHGVLVDDHQNKGKGDSSTCPQQCPVCDGTFFPSLSQGDVGSDRLRGNHGALIQEGKDLVTYAIINAIAMRKILKKYDKETLFDPVSLTCGHIFCYMCACKAGSVTIVDGLTAVTPKQKCPICRQEGVYETAVHLEELHILLGRSCPEYWEERRKSEKIERVQQTKEHWESQCRLFMGI